jgi:hypothetical protein
MFLSNLAVFSQSGIVVASYMEERVALQKMWKARKSGNEDEVNKISLEIKSYIDEKKTWAVELLKITEKSIENNRKEIGINFTNEELKYKNNKIRGIRGEIRYLKMQLKDDRTLFYDANDVSEFEIKSNDEAIKNIVELSKKNIETTLKDIKYYENEIEETKIAGKKEVARLEKCIAKYPDPESLDYVNRQKESLRNIEKLIAEENYRRHPMSDSITTYKKTIECRKNQIKEMNESVKNSTYSFPAGWSMQHYRNWKKNAENALKNLERC